MASTSTIQGPQLPPGFSFNNPDPDSPVSSSNDSILQWYTPPAQAKTTAPAGTEPAKTTDLFGPGEGRFMFSPEGMQELQNKLNPKTLKPFTDQYFHLHMFGKDINIPKKAPMLLGGALVVIILLLVVFSKRR